MPRSKLSQLSRFLFISLFIIGTTFSNVLSEENSDLNSIVLSTVDGESIRASDLLSDDSKITVLEWFNQGCPFVKKHYGEGFMQALQEEYRSKGIKWLVINSTNPEHQDFLNPKERNELQAKWNIKKETLLFDESGSLGLHFSAKTTPHIIIMKGKEIMYSGAIDDAPDTDSDPKKAQNYARIALDELLSGEKVAKPRTRPYGCSIKYPK